MGKIKIEYSVEWAFVKNRYVCPECGEDLGDEFLEVCPTCKQEFEGEHWEYKNDEFN